MMNPLADTEYACRLHTAIRQLVAPDDARLTRGFSAVDRPVGERLAALPPATWTPWHTGRAWRLLRPYQTTLRAAGLALDVIEPPPAAERVLALTADDWFALYFGRDDPIWTTVRALPGAVRQRDPFPHWRVPATPGIGADLQPLAAGFLVTPAAAERLAALRTPDPTAPPRRRIEADPTGGFRLVFPPDPQILTAVQALPERMFQRADPAYWWVPATPALARHLEALAGAHDFAIPAAVATTLRALAAIRDPLPLPPQRIACAPEGGFWITFPKDAAVLAAVHAIPLARYERQPVKRWWVPALPAAVHALIAFAATHPTFVLDPEVPAALDAARTTAQARIARSQATQPTTLRAIPGLGRTPRPFQLAAVEAILALGRCLLADDMGLGKSGEALMALQAAGAFPAVIVAPAGLLENWRAEIAAWLPSRLARTQVLTGQVRPAIYQDADLLLVSYELLEKHLAAGLRAALDARGLAAIVLDEAHYIKSEEAIRTRQAQILAADVPLRILATGTPILNRPMELIPLLQILGVLDAFGGWTGFTFRHCTPVQNRWGWEFRGPAHLTELHEHLRSLCMVRRTKSQVLTELPPLDRVQVALTLSPPAQAEYRRTQQRLAAWVARALAAATADDAAAQAAARAAALAQITILRRTAALGKLPAIGEWITTFLDGTPTEQKLIVFAHHRTTQAALLARFPAAARVLGGMPAPIRQAQVARFQTDPACRLAILSLGAANVGLTLTAADTVLMTESAWTPAINSQAEARAHRLGQQHPVTAIYPYAVGTVEERILALVERKREIVDQVVDGTGAPEPDTVLNDALLDQYLDWLRQRARITPTDGSPSGVPT